MTKSSKTLFVDTATKSVLLALVIDGVVTDLVCQEGQNNHSVTILPLLDDLLKRQNIALRDLTELIVGIGPGSYTGVRIGVSIAKMIGYLNDIPVRTVSSLALLASSASAGTVVGFIDARRENAFMACYDITDDVMTERVADTLENVEAFQTRIPKPYQIVSAGIPDVLKILRSHLTFPVPDIHALVPNYLQVTEAEHNKKASA
ncbi:MAG TPA: tRNA (adenosine(37)-N6)-threonylcarbamoyltransferase complex dimerization subunit type 1 TsaB [Acholeplasmatales bacterium]|nr:tRNA (adenosine(37)-N6)-threonylcarbamoyltransferase complex dimerization subunit type 1 TsaB [Acholeplasmatales bacterium]